MQGGKFLLLFSFAGTAVFALDIPTECPAVDPIDGPIHLPHEFDCRLFYKCSNGAKVQFQCPEGLEFNPKIEVCDWPSAVGCTLSEPGSSDEETEDIGEDTSETVVEPIECPAIDPPDITVHLPHESDCNKFYKCSNGDKHLSVCPSGLFFNPALEVCDWPSDAGCTSSGPGGSDEDIEDNSDETVVEPIECPIVDPLDTAIYLPHEIDCNKFYKCPSGVKYLSVCSPGLIFNFASLKVCIWQWVYDCVLS